LTPVTTPAWPGHPTEAHAIFPVGYTIETTGTAESPPSAMPLLGEHGEAGREGVAVCFTAAPRWHTDVEHRLAAQYVLECDPDAARCGAARHAGDQSPIDIREPVIDEPPAPRQAHVSRQAAEPTLVGNRAVDRGAGGADHRRKQRGEQPAVGGADRVRFSLAAQHGDAAQPLQARPVVREHGRGAGSGLRADDLTASLAAGHLVSDRTPVNEPRDHEHDADQRQDEPRCTPRPRKRGATATDHQVRHAPR
jgi:hypothetical protein